WRPRSSPCWCSSSSSSRRPAAPAPTTWPPTRPRSGRGRRRLQRLGDPGQVPGVHPLQLPHQQDARGQGHQQPQLRHRARPRQRRRRLAAPPQRAPAAGRLPRAPLRPRRPRLLRRRQAGCPAPRPRRQARRRHHALPDLRPRQRRQVRLPHHHPRARRRRRLRLGRPRRARQRHLQQGRHRQALQHLRPPDQQLRRAARGHHQAARPAAAQGDELRVGRRAQPRAGEVRASPSPSSLPCPPVTMPIEEPMEETPASAPAPSQGHALQAMMGWWSAAGVALGMACVLAHL
ncbi:hypothetical protein CFC21_105202, partial [Triticum aestivum]